MQKEENKQEKVDCLQFITLNSKKLLNSAFTVQIGKSLDKRKTLLQWQNEGRLKVLYKWVILSLKKIFPVSGCVKKTWDFQKGIKKDYNLGQDWFTQFKKFNLQVFHLKFFI